MRSVCLNRGGAWLLVGLLCVLLAACATPARIDSASTGPVFERTGRFALSVEHAGGKRDAVQGGFAWRDTAKELRLDLANPLGNTLARVQVVPTRATLIRSDGSREEAHNPDALVELVLGSPIPVAGLRDWLRGQTGSAPLNLEKDEAGHPTSFSQQGWRVRLSRYDDQGPRLLQLNRNEASRNISVRLVIDGS